MELIEILQIQGSLRSQMIVDPETYFISTGNSESRLIIKNSKFFSIVEKCSTEEKAMEILHGRSREYSNASHHCWAYRVGAPPTTCERYSDAGEPSGTAGRPILDQIRKIEVVNVLSIVPRLFGGL